MLWPLAAALLYLLLSIRVSVDAALELGRARSALRLRIVFWGIRLFIDRPLEMDIGRAKAGKPLEKIRKAWPYIRTVLSAIVWGQTDIRMRIGTQEAGATAMLAGAAYSAASLLQAAGGRRFPCSVRVEPDFRTPCFALSGRCIFSCAPGDIMLAALRLAVKKKRKEGIKWLSTPLKA